MKKTLVAALAAMMVLFAAGCDNGSSDPDPGQQSMLGGEINAAGVLTKYTGSETAVVIPDGVTGIGHNAFNGCTSLESVTIPASVTYIGSYAFYGCASLTDVTYGGTLAQWCALDGVGDLMYYAKSVTMGDGTDLKQEKELVIPEDVTSIGNYAFRGCESLESVTIPEGVTSIGNYAFYWCTSLESVEIPEGVTSIGSSAFYWCTSLESVEIPGSVTSIGDSAFYNCESLDTVTYQGTLAQWCAVNGDNNLMYYAKSVTMGDGTDLKQKKKLVIPEDVESIGNSAFYGCTSLESVTIPDGVTGIGNYAFYKCTSLASVTIPEGVTSIGDYAFGYCYNLKEVTYGGTKEQWDKIEKEGSNIFYGNVTITGKGGVTFTVDYNGNITTE